MRQFVRVPVSTHGAVLAGDLTVPRTPKGVVIFAPDAGTCRNDLHELVVAEKLQEAGLATLRIDPLDEHEARDRHNVFDEELIATRLLEAARWLARERSTRNLPLGYLGTGTGAAAALIAAAQEPQRVAAVVSRRGRPDMALSWLHRVQAPTLFIIGEHDECGLHCNEDACRRIPAQRSLVLIPGADHLFVEKDALEKAAGHALCWFERHLGTPAGNDAAAA